MGLTADVNTWRIKTIPGMNTKQETFELNGNWVEKAQNCRFEEELGAVSKRKPISYFNAVADKIGTSPIIGLYRYYYTGGAKFVSVSDTSAYVGTDSSGVFTAIRTGLTAGKRTIFLTYDDLLFAFNGYDNTWVYDGSGDNVTWELGSCKAKAGDGTGITRTDISYTITYDDDSICSGAVSNIISSVTNKDIDLSCIPLGPVGCVNRKIYRKSSETGGVYRLAGTITTSTQTTFTDNTNDLSSATVRPDVTDAIPKGNIPIVFRERLFLAGDPNKPNTIYYSYPYLPHIMLQTTGPDTLEVSPEDNDEITGLAIHMGMLNCIKKNNLRKIYVTGPDDTWYAEDPVIFCGSPAPWSVVSTSRGIVFLGWDHWYLYNGVSVDPIIDQFDTADILQANYSDVVSYFHDDHLLAAYTDATLATQYHNRVMRYNIKRDKLSYDTINCNCFASKRGDDELGQLYYGSSKEGFVYKASQETMIYRLGSKSDANLGTKTNIFVGGTESSPYIEIGSTTSALAIPNNICIFWDDNFTNPGSGWTELTSVDGRFVMIDTGAPTTGSVGKTVNSDTGSTEATVQSWRLFYKNATTTEYEFPTNSIVMYDQPTPPTGYMSIASGKYIKIDSVVSSGTERIWSTTGTGAAYGLDTLTDFNFIKKVGEADTWDGASKYVYALYYSAAALTNGWSDATTTYKGFLRTLHSEPTRSLGGDTEYDIDLLNDFLDTTHTVTSTLTEGTDSSNPIGTYGSTHDGNDSSFYQYYIHHSGDGRVIGEMTSEHTWIDAIRVESTKLKAHYERYTLHHYDEYAATFRQQLKISGTWTTVSEKVFPRAHDYNGTPENSHANIAYDVSTKYAVVTSTPVASTPTTVSNTAVAAATGWDDVTGYRTYLYGEDYGYEGDRQQWVKMDIYEEEAFGQYNYATFNLAKKVLGKMKDYNAALDAHTSSTATWESPTMQINSTEVGKLYWNEDVEGSDTLSLYFKTGATQAACDAASYSSAIDNYNGSELSSYISANIWIKYKIVFGASATPTSNPRVYTADGFLVKFLYSQQSVEAETEVEFIYSLGYRNFDLPMTDKIHKKIGTIHEGSEGSFKLMWETENSDDEFVIDLTANSERWSSFFQDTAMGENLNVTIYKNDNYEFMLKEINGIYSPLKLLL